VSAFYHNKDRARFIETARKQFVCLALDSYYLGNGAEIEWTKGFTRTNGITYVTASGRLLGYRLEIDQALEEFRKLPEEERKPRVERPQETKPGRVLPAPPEGTQVARLYCTYLERDGKGELARSAKYAFREAGRSPAAAMTRVDNFWLSREEAGSLVPADPKEGQRTAAPEAVRRRLFELALCDMASRCRHTPRAGELALTVEKVSAEGVDLRLEGTVKNGAEFDPADIHAHGSEFRILGFLRTDPARGRLTRFDVLALGEVWGKDRADRPKGYYGYLNWAWDCRGKEHRRHLIGLSFELVPGESALDRIAPLHACHPAGPGGVKRYFGQAP
jgi:hypothetical protein